MTGAEILTKFTADTSQVDKATKNFSNSVSSLTKAFTLGNLAAKGISKAISVFNSSLDSAIKRTDTLNNFPKVMSNLGIGADDAEDAIKTLSDKLSGLPTTLDAAASAVQRFTSGNGDVKKSTSYFLAVNNAILAGGASADIQASALEQLSQAYSKGKPDMMEWRTLMMAMPAQLKQVATAMGYVNANDLGEALRKGDVSMDKFMQTIEKMNTQGVNGFKSFEEQAKNSTGGIQTSIQNMKTAFSRGVASVISSTDEALKDFGGISGVLNKIGKVGEKVFKALGKGIQKVIPIIVKIINWIKEHHKVLTAILVPLGVFIATFKTIKVIIGILASVKAGMVALFTIIKANPIGLLISAIAALVGAFTYLWNHCEGFRNFFIGMWETIKLKFKLTLEALKLAIKGFVEGAKVIWQGMEKLIIEPIKTAVEKVKKVLGTIVDFFGNIWKKIKEKFTDIGTKIGESVSEAFKNVINACLAAVEKVVNFPINAINKLVDGINDLLGTDIGKLKTIDFPRLATGTNYVPEDMLAMIHKGEAVVPKKFNPYANGVNTNTINNMNVPTPNITINITNDMKFDALGQMVNKIKTFSGGSKNDFNYGMGR